MSVQRDWTPADPRQAFFPVEVRPAFWMDDRDRHHYIPGQKVLVDAERGNPLAVVSERYHLITNEEAYRMADVIVRGVFDDRTLSNFECYNVMMPSTRSSCRMDFIIPQNQFSAFGDRKESFGNQVGGEYLIALDILLGELVASYGAHDTHLSVPGVAEPAEEPEVGRSVLVVCPVEEQRLRTIIVVRLQAYLSHIKAPPEDDMPLFYPISFRISLYFVSDKQKKH